MDQNNPPSAKRKPIHPLSTGNGYYSQNEDPTLRPFMRQGEHFIAERAMVLQERGIVPESQVIRVNAVRQPFQRFGAGLDEGVPTNLGRCVALLRDPASIGAQSGLRALTDRILLVSPDGTVSGHTGFFRSAAGSSTNTRGQAAAHDVRRAAFRNLNGSFENRLSSLSAAFIKSTPNGIQIIESQNITGGIPNITLIGPIEAGLGPNRYMLASGFHEAREAMKRRLSRLEGELGVPRSSSPERSAITRDGKGGTYIKDGERGRSPSPYRQIPGQRGTKGFAANATAYVSQPLRTLPIVPTQRLGRSPFPTYDSHQRDMHRLRSNSRRIRGNVTRLSNQAPRKRPRSQS